MKPKINPSARRKARHLALQAIYQWHLSGDNVKEIEAQFTDGNYIKKADGEYFFELLRNIITNVEEVDEKLKLFLDRTIKEINPIELGILRIGVYEIYHRPEIPFRVILNEAVELAKVFGSEQGYRYVNGVLNKLARQIRQAENPHFLPL